MLNFYMARQPIYDRKLEVIGYELLYRGQDTSSAQVLDGDEATAQVILNTFIGSNLEEIVGNHPAFINLTDNFILGKYPLPFSPDKVVLEIPEDIIIDRERVTAINSLVGQGFKFALDDVTSADILPLVRLAGIAKFDLTSLRDRAELEKLTATFRKFPIKLLAEKVETQAELEFCQELGFDMFQGYFLCRPSNTSGSLMEANRVAMINLFGKLHQPYVDYKELEEVVAMDVALGVKILRLVNSAAYGVSNRITSIHHAMTIIGLEPLKGWLTLFLLSNRNDKPRELTTIAMVRAKMCELLAMKIGTRTTGSYFLTGLLSVLDAMVDLPLERILDQISLSQDIRDALLSGKGPLGECLNCVRAYEQADWSQSRFGGLSPNGIREIYLKTITWVDYMKSVLES